MSFVRVWRSTSRPHSGGGLVGLWKNFLLPLLVIVVLLAIAPYVFGFENKAIYSKP